MLSIRSISLALLLLFGQTPRIPGPGGGSPRGFNYSYVAGSVTACQGGTGAHPLSKCIYAWHVAPTLNSVLSCEAFWADASNVITATMTGSSNGAYTAITPKQNDGAFSSEMFQYLKSGNAAENITFQLSGGTASLAGFECAAYHPAGGGGSIQDGTPVYFLGNSTGTTGTVGPTTVSNSQGMLIAHCLGVASSCSAGSGFTGRNDTAGCNWDTVGNAVCVATNINYNGGTGSLIEDKFNAATGSESATFTTGSGDSVTLGLLSY